MSFLSLTQRLLIGALLWVVGGMLVAGLLLHHLFKQHLEQQLYKELNTHLQQLATQTDFTNEQQLFIKQALSDPRFEQPLSGLYWQITSTTGTTSLYSESLWDESINPLSSELGTLYTLTRDITFAEEESSPSYTFRVAAHREFVSEPLQRFMQMLLFTLAVIGVVLVLGVWWQLRLGLQPLRQLRRQLVAVHEGKSATIAGQYPQEIQPLVSEFNRVLNSNAQVLERARTQAGNLAHAVKTPLAILANAAKKEDSALAHLVIEQVNTTQQQVDYQLSRARAAAAVKTIGVRTEVVPAVHSLSKLLQRAYEHKPVLVHCSNAAPELYFKGEAQDLHEILGNLLDNAFKWCKLKINVNVQRPVHEPLRIVIDDDGPGLTEGQYEKVFKRGVRADEMVAGSGLGLAIVADLVQLYGGEITAMRSPIGGVRMVLVLP